MGIHSGRLRERLRVLNRKAAESSAFGIDGKGVEWEDCGEFHAAVEWARGTRALNAGALDVYCVDSVLMRWNCVVNGRSRIMHDGQVYQILPETFHADKHENTIEFKMQALVEG